MTVDSARLRLRPLELFDRQAFCRILSDPKVHGSLRLDADPSDRAALRALFEERRAEVIAGRPSRFAITLRVDSRFVGSIGAYGIDQDRIGLSYWLDSALHGRGIGREALRAFSLWAFGAYGRRVLQANVADTNAASIAVLRNAGYTPAEQADDPVFGSAEGRLLFSLQAGEPATPQLSGVRKG